MPLVRESSSGCVGEKSNSAVAQAEFSLDFALRADAVEGLGVGHEGARERLGLESGRGDPPPPLDPGATPLVN